MDLRRKCRVSWRLPPQMLNSAIELHHKGLELLLIYKLWERQGLTRCAIDCLLNAQLLRYQKRV